MGKGERARERERARQTQREFFFFLLVLLLLLLLLPVRQTGFLLPRLAQVSVWQRPRGAAGGGAGLVPLQNPRF